MATTGRAAAWRDGCGTCTTGSASPPAQQPQWDAVVATLRENAQSMRASPALQALRSGQLNAVQALRASADLAQQRADNMARLVPAVDALYASLSPPQRQEADQVMQRFVHRASARPPPRLIGTEQNLARRRAGPYRAGLRRRSASAAQRQDRHMKPGIHPEYHEVTVIMTDGTQFTTRTCAGKAGTRSGSTSTRSRTRRGRACSGSWTPAARWRSSTRSSPGSG